MDENRKKETRDKTFIFRMTDDEMKNLEYLSYMSDKSKSEIVREGIRLVSNINKYR